MNRLIQFSHFILSLLLILSISGCKNDIEESPPITDYFPVVNGANWSNNIPGSTVMNITGSDSNGNQFFQLSNTIIANFTLSSNEVRWTFLSAAGNDHLFFHTPDPPQVLLNRPLVKGHSWFSAGIANVKSEIIYTDTSVLNLNYGIINNVLVVRETYTYPSGYAFSAGIELQYRLLYYAKGIGLVRMEAMTWDYISIGPFEINGYTIP